MRFIAVALLLAACRTGQPGKPNLITCSANAVAGQGPTLLPAINACLTVPADASVAPCLLGLIRPVAGVTETLLACLVRDAAETPGAAGTTRQAAGARARQFLRDRGYVFAAPPPFTDL